jgi:hypothetical protein
MIVFLSSLTNAQSYDADNTRCFACTGLLITGKDCPLVLTSASLLRTDDAEGEIDENLKVSYSDPIQFPWSCNLGDG